VRETAASEGHLFYSDAREECVLRFEESMPFIAG